MQTHLGNLTIAGIKNLVFRSKRTKEVVGDIKYLININLSDELSKDFLRGGIDNPKLLTIFGDREATFTGETATISQDLIRILTSTESVVKEVEQDFVENYYVDGGANKITLQRVPNQDYLEVYSLTANGERVKRESVTVNDKVITLSETPDLTSPYAVYYRANVEVLSNEVKDIAPNVYDLSALIVFKELETKKVRAGWLRIPSASVQPKYVLTGKNEASASEPVELTIDCLNDTQLGFSYSIDWLDEREMIKCGLIKVSPKVKIGTKYERD